MRQFVFPHELDELEHHVLGEAFSIVQFTYVFGGYISNRNEA